MSRPAPATFHVLPFPRSRRLVVDAADFAQRRHTVRGLIEVDMTLALRRLRPPGGERLSLTAFVAYALARAVEADRRLQAYLDWRGRLVVFDDVDIGVIVEVSVEGRSFPLAHVLRGVNRRTVRSVHDELRAVQARPSSSPSLRRARWAGLFLRLPGVLRRGLYRWLSRQPQRWKASFGTVGLTSLGMFGAGAGWALALPVYPLTVTVGGLSLRPAVLGGRVVPRELLNLTLDFDHDLVDGAPAARFVRRLRALLEGATGLDEADGAVPQKEEFI
ncbi:2-oxo acid dehydrogenase subunit E2 [Deinococcus koreensis]|uniref:Dehydrogenase n=1 Tax=Deinococcus koreensis TaxID=2054903 RepID=A0A2K3USQ9_9DEIO|nr:2-oxo acid dehydrogenase subunit E2 [Deinococcus koreensis]PNY79558.1 dehydrogenase [Deinococcus koreensis]